LQGLKNQVNSPDISEPSPDYPSGETRAGDYIGVPGRG